MNQYSILSKLRVKNVVIIGINLCGESILLVRSVDVQIPAECTLQTLIMLKLSNNNYNIKYK